MPEKLGNGGHGREEYDPNTGKYMADGQPNKVYNNPEENISEKQQIALNNLKLFYEFGEYTDEEYEEQRRQILNTNESFDKDLDIMSDEELITEIGKHTEFFKSQGIDLSNFENAFNFDRKLKCANYRKLSYLIKKYNVDMNGMSFLFSNEFFESKETCAAVSESFSVYFNDDNVVFNVTPSSRLTFNPDVFSSMQRVKETVIRNQVIGHWVNSEQTDEQLASLILTHEFGHILINQFFYNSIGGQKGLQNLVNQEKRLAEIEWNRDPNLWSEYIDGFNDYLKDRIKQGYRKRKSQMISNWMENSRSELESFGLQFEESEYAKKNPEEWFAETFASLESGRPTDTAKDLKFKLETKGFIRGEK